MEINDEIIALSSSAKESILPAKSKQIYGKEYEAYQSWCKIKKIEKTTEDSILAYFHSELGSYKSSSLSTKYSMLRSMINLHEGVDIKNFPTVIAYLKKKGEDYKPKKSYCLTSKHVHDFLTQADDRLHLLNKVVLIFGVAGACRRQELTSLTRSCVQDFQSHFSVKILDTKTHQNRSFIILPEDLKNRNSLDIIRKYMKLRPPNIHHDRFFINYLKEKCTVQPVGVHKIAGVPSVVAKFLSLENPSSYTSHCFRRSSANLLRKKRHQQKPEASEIVNSIIPDFETKFEELPIHSIRELCPTLEPLDTNIGTVDKNAPYDLQSQYMEQADNCHSSDDNYAKTKLVSSQEPDGRVLYLNSEDVEFLLVKEEMTLEASEEITAEDSGDEDNLLLASKIEDITSEDEFDKFQTSIEGDGSSSGADNSVLSSINSEADNHVSSQNQLENSTYNPNHQRVEEETPHTSFNQVTPERNSHKETNNEAIVQDSLVSSMPTIRINSNLFESPLEPLSPQDNNTAVEDIGAPSQHQVQECSLSNSTVVNEIETEKEENSRINAVANEQSSDNEFKIEISDDVCVKSEPTENVYISVTVQRKKTPVNLAEVTEMMFEFDREIDKLTKLRQSILTEVSKKSSQEVQVENNALLKRKLNVEHNDENSKKRKTIDSHDEPTFQTPRISKELLPMDHYMQKINRKSKTCFDEDNLPDVIVILKVFEPLKILLAGTRDGLLQCFDLSNYFLEKSLKLYTTKVAGLECPWEISEVEPLIFAGTPQLSELTIIEYKAFKILKKLTLKDGVRVMCSSWDYLFLGGFNGYLTRYNLKTFKIEYEESICTKSIIDLKATSEGCSRNLVILTGDGTSTQIQIRDAKSGLHIRHLGDFYGSTCVLLYSCNIVVASTEGINMFNFLNGKFKCKLSSEKQVTDMCSLGNLMLMSHAYGILIHDLKHMIHLENLKFKNVSAFVPFDNKVIAASQTNQLKTLNLESKILRKL